jgi:hypothetical protein
MRDEKMAKLKGERLIVPVSVPCFNWTDACGDSTRKTVIIAPIKIVECEDGSIQISWACNRGAYCKDQKCRYSHAAQAQES